MKKLSKEEEKVIKVLDTPHLKFYHIPAMKKYQAQILIEDLKNRPKKKWVSLKAYHAKTPYQFDTEAEAYSNLRMCYGAVLCCDEMRVIEVF